MIDPKEKEEQPANSGGEADKKEPKQKENTNWDEHQQIDEEGNEVGPDDIK